MRYRSPGGSLGFWLCGAVALSSLSTQYVTSSAADVRTGTRIQPQAWNACVRGGCSDSTPKRAAFTGCVRINRNHVNTCTVWSSHIAGCVTVIDSLLQCYGAAGMPRARGVEGALEREEGFEEGRRGTLTLARANRASHRSHHGAGVTAPLDIIGCRECAFPV